MNPEQNSSQASEQFNDCFKITGPRQVMIQFVGERMVWGFNWSLLNYFVLRANPDCHDPKVEPPDELILYFHAAKVTLLGWCLDLMLDDIASHNIARVWKLKKELPDPNNEVAWISGIFVLPDDYDVLAEHAEPAAASRTSNP